MGFNPEEIGYLYHAPGIAGGDKEKARGMIRDLKSMDGRLASLLEASILGEEEESAASFRILESLLEKHPGDDQARQALAFGLQQKERFEEASRHFAALAESEDSLYMLMGQYQMARSRILGKFEPERAVDLLDDYLQNDPEVLVGLPSRSSAFWRLGNAYEQLEEVEKARHAYRDALALDPDNKEARKALKQLPNN